MKPATLALFTFLASLIIYSVLGIFLVGIINSNCFGACNGNNYAYNYEIMTAIVVVASIVTGYLTYMFERWPPVTTSHAT